MGAINQQGGGARSNTRANTDIPADRLWVYSPIVDEIRLCAAGNEADGICLVAVQEGEVLNLIGSCQTRKDTGVYSDVTIADTFTAGSEFMSSATGEVINYVYSATVDNRALGKYLSSGENGDKGKILLYSK